MRAVERVGVSVDKFFLREHEREVEEDGIVLRDCEIVRHRWFGCVDWHGPEKEESIEFYEE